MQHKQIFKWSLLAVAVALAAMGCWFCRNCPAEWLFEPSGRSAFVRQVTCNALGLVFFAGAAALRWKWWRKSAPWLLAVWAVLAVDAFLFGVPVNGVRRWVSIGFLRINVRTLFIPFAALFAAWFCARGSAKPWMIYVVTGLLLAACGYGLVSNANRLERIAFFLEDSKSAQCGAWAHCQLKAAFGAAKWFGDAGLNIRHLPNPLNDGMASAAALTFGKWFPIAVFGLFATLGGLLTALWLGLKNVSGRMFLLFWGAGTMVPAIYGFFQCIGFVPVVGCTPTPVGFDGTSVIVFWLGFGALLSFLREADWEIGGRWRAANVVVWSLLFGVFCVGVGVASGTKLKFVEPPQNEACFRDFWYNTSFKLEKRR